MTDTYGTSGTNGNDTAGKVILGVGGVAVAAVFAYSMLSQARKDALYNATRSIVKQCPLIGRLVTVSPTLTVADPRAVFQSKPVHNPPDRIAVRMGTDVAFDGKGTLTVTNATGVSLYEKSVGGVPLPLPLQDIPGDKLTAGYTLYLECTQASPGPNHIGLTLNLHGGSSRLGAPVTEHLTCLTPTLELYRGASLLAVVPFASIDNCAVIDGALPDNLQNVPAQTRPGNLDAAFTFPNAQSYADNPHADADPDLFRLRLKHVPPSFTQPQIDLTLRVLTSGAAAIDRVATVQRYAGTASHGGGMRVQLQKKHGEQLWESPYLRVATTLVQENSGGTHGVVHSLPPLGSVQLDHGKQFGRLLRVTGTLGPEQLQQDFTMGGEPFARIPVKFFWVSNTAPTQIKQQVARDKIYNLNQYWAGQGLEFALETPGTPMHLSAAPQRTILSIGDFTGPATVAPYAFTVELDLAVTVQGNGAQPVNLVVDVQGNRSPSEVASAIQTAISNWVAPGHGPLAGLQLDADTFDLPQARAYLSFPALVLNNGAPNNLPLQLLGTRGPADVAVRKATGCVVNVTEIAITRLLVRSLTGGNPDTTIDIHAPPVSNPYHDAMFIPQAAATRHWVRAFSPPGKNFISVIVESNQHSRLSNGNGYPHRLCESGFGSLHDGNLATMQSRFAAPLSGGVAESRSEAYTLMNFGLWTEPSAELTLFMADSVFTVAKNDLQHEVGHVLSDLDHTIYDPEWFYVPELLHSGGPAPERILHMTRHKLYVDCIVNDGGWKATYKALERGYGGAIRTRLAGLKPAWLVGALAAGQPSW